MKPLEHFFLVGYNPNELRGSKTGVYCGASFEDCAAIYPNAFQIASDQSGTMRGSSLFPLANTISFLLDLKGPSHTVDSGCSASLVALGMAMKDLRSGACDRALVVACNSPLDGRQSASLVRIGALSSEGKCKHLDSGGDGYVRSEAMVALLIENKNTALRAYGRLRHLLVNNDGFKEEGRSFPGVEGQKSMLEMVYQEANIDPNSVVYVECHGTGTKAGDPVETKALAAILAKGRDSPLLIGSVKTNIGHTEGASGLCGVVKVLMAAQNSLIPGNLHFQKANRAIECLIDGKVNCCQSNTPFEGGIMGVSGFGIGGTNAHVIIEAPYFDKESKIIKTKQHEESKLPLLITFSSRNEQTFNQTIDLLLENDLEKN